MDRRRATSDQPSEQLIEQLWIAALCSRGRLPMPTVGRVRELRKLVAAWEADKDEA